MSGIGIDLGTSYSCVAVWQHGKVDVIANEVGMTTTPSLVAFNSAEQLCGEAAESQQPKNPVNTIYDVKRLMGAKFSSAEVQNDIKNWPFTVEKGENDKPMIVVQFKGEEKKFTPE